MLKHIPSPDGHEQLSQAEIDFVLRHTQTLRALFRAKLYGIVEGSTKPKGQEWVNVARHCIAVARTLDALGEMLGLSQEERDHMAHVGLVHDWNKRLTKDGDSFTGDERRDAEAYAARILEEHDPEGRLIDATEPRGLPRLESNAATLAEHCVHFVDLSCLPTGLVSTEERFRDFERRGKIHDEDGQANMWERKRALVAKEEAMLLDIIRRNGVDVPEGTRLYELLRERIASADHPS